MLGQVQCLTGSDLGSNCPSSWSILTCCFHTLQLHYTLLLNKDTNSKLVISETNWSIIIIFSRCSITLEGFFFKIWSRLD